jgi:hypothetical protein
MIRRNDENARHVKNSLRGRYQCMVNRMVLSSANANPSKDPIPWMTILAVDQRKLCRIQRTKRDERPVVDKGTDVMSQEQRN